MNIRYICSLFVVLLVVAACTDLAGQPEIVATIELPPTHEPVSVSDPTELGAAIFAARCTDCHGVTGLGDGQVAMQAGITVPDFTVADTASNQSLEEWTQTIRVGRLENLMPPWENSLTAEEIDAVAEYTYNLWQNPIEVAATVLDDEAPEVAMIEGRITGRIIQGTADEPMPETIFMGLHILDSNDQQVDFRTQELSGSPTAYAFDDVTLRSDYRYLVTVVYNDIVFSSNKIAPDGSSPTLSIPMTIYEITNDPSVIEIDLMTMLLFEENDRLVVQKFLSFVNTSDRVFRTDAQVDTFAYESVRIPLPQDATLLNMQALEQRFSVEQEGDSMALVDSRPVVPGENHAFEIVYGVPTSRNLSLEITTAHAVTVEPEILLQPEMYTLSGGSFGEAGTQNFDFGAYDRYVAFPMAADGVLTIDLKRVGSEALPRDVIVSVIVLIVGLSFISVGVYSLYQQKRKVRLADEQTASDIN